MRLFNQLYVHAAVALFIAITSFNHRRNVHVCINTQCQSSESYVANYYSLVKVKEERKVTTTNKTELKSVYMEGPEKVTILLLEQPTLNECKYLL